MKFVRVYLNYSEAVKRGSIVDYKEYFQQYDSGDNKMELLKGSPKIINIEGHYVLYDDIPYLVDKKMRFFVTSVHDNEQHIEYLWRRNNKGDIKR